MSASSSWHLLADPRVERSLCSDPVSANSISIKDKVGMGVSMVTRLGQEAGDGRGTAEGVNRCEVRDDCSVLVGWSEIIGGGKDGERDCEIT